MKDFFESGEELKFVISGRVSRLLKPDCDFVSKVFFSNPQALSNEHFCHVGYMRMKIAKFPHCDAFVFQVVDPLTRDKTWLKA